MYSACSRCTAKFFTPSPVTRCPRCGGSLLVSTRSPPPWTGRRDSPVPRGHKAADVSSRRGASWDLRGALRALVQEKPMPPVPANEVAKTLACQVRVLTVRQIAATFFRRRKNPLDCARRAVRTLKRRGMAEDWQACLAEQAPAGPLWRGVAGDTLLDAPSVAWQNSQRWRTVKPNRTTCVQATDKARAAFAGSCRPTRPSELEHDLAVSAVFLRFKSLGLDADWRHEDGFAAVSGCRADATYRRDNELITVEVLGRGYDREKVAMIWLQHRDALLELW